MINQKFDLLSVQWQKPTFRSLCNIFPLRISFCFPFFESRALKIELFNPLGRLWPRRHTNMKEKKKNQSVSLLFCWRFAGLFLENRRTSSRSNVLHFISSCLWVGGVFHHKLVRLQSSMMFFSSERQKTTRDDGANCNIRFAFRHGNISVLQFYSHPNND